MNSSLQQKSDFEKDLQKNIELRNVVPEPEIFGAWCLSRCLNLDVNDITYCDDMLKLACSSDNEWCSRMSPSIYSRVRGQAFDVISQNKNTLK